MKLINGASIKAITKTVESAVKKNAPQILAGLGIAFGLGAVGMTARGTVKAVRIVDEMKKENPEPTKKEIVKAVYKEYLPAAGLTVAGIGCVVGSVHISARRIATLGLAYAMSDKNFKEYKDKAKEMLGEKKEEELRGKIAQDYIDRNPPQEKLIQNAEGGGVLCLDKLTGQYFYSDADTIIRVVNELNRLLLSDYHVSFNDYFIELGLQPCGFGDEWGWNLEDGDLIQPTFTSELLATDNTPVLVVDFIVGPRPNFRMINNI